jgi:cell wall-associated NlpC family hydrolase
MLWLATLGVLGALLLFPPSYRSTRFGLLFIGAIAWLGFIALTWPRRGLRWALLAITFVAGGFFLLPARESVTPEQLRAEYLAQLQRYDGVSYYWGGETHRGIDCSGLIRRGLIDALIWRGLQAADASPVRQGIFLWWDDCSANALSTHHHGQTIPVLNTGSLNTLDHGTILPGDLAITESGVHILAYLGENRWIQADPMAGKVIIDQARATENAWFDFPIKIVRWTILSGPSEGTVSPARKY